MMRTVGVGIIQLILWGIFDLIFSRLKLFVLISYHITRVDISIKNKYFKLVIKRRIFLKLKISVVHILLHLTIYGQCMGVF